MEEQQLINEKPHSGSTSEGQVCHITEGQSSTKVTVATQGSGEPGQVDSQ